jgi:hypothetical protein
MAININITTTFLGDTDTPNSYIGQGTKKVVVKADASGLEFVPDTGGSDTNIMYDDLTATADRSQNMNSKSMTFINGKQFKWINNVAPTIGEASFDLQAYGTTSSDTLINIKNGSGTSKFKMSGVGQIGIGANPFTQTRVYINAISGEKGIYVDAVDETAGYFESSSGRGVSGRSPSNFGGDFYSGGSFAVNAMGFAGYKFKPNNADNGRYSVNILSQADDSVFQVKNDMRIISAILGTSTVYINDAAAQAGGVELYELYMNNTGLTVRRV